MAYKLLGGGSDINTVVSDMNSNLLQLKGEEVVKVIRDEQGTRVAVLDKNGLRTTAPGSGVDVITATPEQYTFNSSQNTLKIVQSGTTTLPGHTLTIAASQYGSGSSIKIIDHNLGYIPAVLAYVDSGGTYVGLPSSGWVSGNSSSFMNKTVDYAVTDTQIYFYMTTNGYNRSQTFSDQPIKYYLLQETAA